MSTVDEPAIYTARMPDHTLDTCLAKANALMARGRRFGVTAEMDQQAAELLEEGRFIIEAGRQVAECVLTAVRVAYEQAGSPYGSDDAGMWQWVREEGERRAVAEKAEQEHAWQAGLAEVQRRLVEQNRRN